MLRSAAEDWVSPPGLLMHVGRYILSDDMHTCAHTHPGSIEACLAVKVKTTQAISSSSDPSIAYFACRFIKKEVFLYSFTRPLQGYCTTI
jgi:hypothetical protein